MTPAEYLRARGWREFDGAWERGRIAGELRFTYPLNDAVALQVYEDRACYNFVRERSGMRDGLLVESEA